MQTKFKDISQYYLGTGLRLSDTYDGGRNTDFLGISIDEEVLQFTLNDGDIDWGNITAFKPLLRSLDSLTKPITVKGYNDDKEFVPVNKLKHIYGWEYVWSYCSNKQEEFNVNAISFASIKLLLQWHFNIFNLHETEYIKID